MTIPEPGGETLAPSRWRAFSVCLVAAFMTLLDVSIVNVALPSIRTGLQASQTELQWIVSGYALAFGLVLVPAGRLGDVRGRRTVFVASLVLFTAASAACGLAPSAPWLVAARLVQGVAGGLLNPQVSGFVQELFRGPERGRAFGLQGAIIGISTAIGPLAGGALIAVFGVEHGWRSVFFVNVPIGVVATVLALRLLPAPSAAQRRRRQSLDPVGVLLLGAGVMLLLLPLVERGSVGAAGMPWWLAPLAVVVLVGFGFWERDHARRGHEPMVDLSLFRRLSYAFGVAVGLVYFAGFTAIFFVFALYLQSGLGYGALQSGLAITPFAAGSAVAALLAGRVVIRFGRPLVAAGLAVVAVALAVTAVVVHLSDGRSTGLLTVLPLLVAGLGSGAVISPNVTLTLSEVPVEQAGTAGGVLQTAQRIGAAVGIAVVGTVFFARVTAGGGRPDVGVWTGALVMALSICSVAVTVALLVALADVVQHRRTARREAAGVSAGVAPQESR
jgi:EmrB/QacA subfamily drug resistance transporter